MAAAQSEAALMTIVDSFVREYYRTMRDSPSTLHQYYKDTSKLGRPENDGSMSITTTVKAIKEKILSLNYGEFRTDIKTIDAQVSFNKVGFQVLVTGSRTGKDNMTENFAQSLFVVPQYGKYFVANDMIRYGEKFNNHDGKRTSVKDVEAPVTHKQESPRADLVKEDHLSKQVNVLSEEEWEHVAPPESDGLAISYWMG